MEGNRNTRNTHLDPVQKANNLIWDFLLWDNSVNHLEVVLA